MRVLVVHERDLAPAAGGGLDARGPICGSRGGGLATYLTTTTAALRAAGEDVRLIGFDPDIPGEEHLAEGYDVLRSFRFHKRPATVAAFRRLVEHAAPDVVHLQGVFYEIAPDMMAWLIDRYPTVWTLHDVRPLCFRGSRLQRDGTLCHRAVGKACVGLGCYRPGERDTVPRDALRIVLHERYMRSYRRLERVVVVSAYLGEALVENGFDPARLTVAPLFSRFEAGGDSESSGGDTDVPQILFAGRLDEGKGVEEFLGAMSRLGDLAWDAAVVGDGPRADAAHDLARRLGVADRVTFTGSRTGAALADAFRRAGLVVLSSILPEGCPLVGIEAMGFGRPVVAFRIGGVTQYLRHGENGLLAKHRDIDDLARQVRRLLEDPALRARLGRAAARCAAHEFTLDRHIRDLQQVYRQARDAHRRPHVGVGC